MEKKYILIIGIIIVLLAFGIWQFARSSVTGKVIEQEKKEVKEPKCPYDYEVKSIEDNFANKDHIADDCPNINGGTHEGILEVEIEVLNQNDVALSIPCQFIFTKTFFNSDPIPSIEDTRDFKIFVGAKSTKKETITENFPSCYTGWKIECKDVDELPECK